jgi:uncharacterized protein YggU (UPF0235/DUF167 family)
VAFVTVRVTPRAASERIGPYRDGVLELRVSRPPTDGQATDAARRLLARGLGVPPSAVRLASGERSRVKRFEIIGQAQETVEVTLRRHRLAD